MSKNMNLDGVHLYKEALSDFIFECKKIDIIYDILLRGTSCDWDDIVPFWSDIDLTVIIEEISYYPALKIRELYSSIQNKYNFKISLTLVTLEDYKNKHHHHGSKPLYYNTILNDAKSLYNRTYPIKHIENTSLTRYDCYLNLVYLIHDLRKRLLAVNENNKSEFVIHLLKRSKHLVRNSIFVLSGYIDEDINFQLAEKYFPNIDQSFFSLLQNEKTTCVQKAHGLDELIKSVFNGSEKIYELMLRKIEAFPDLLEFQTREEMLSITSLV